MINIILTFQRYTLSSKADSKSDKKNEEEETISHGLCFPPYICYEII